MTTRERVLTTVLVAVMVLLGGGVLFHLLVLEPISSARAQLHSAQEQLIKKQAELDQEMRQIDQIFRVNPRLKQWQKISLPPRDGKGKVAGVSPQEQKRKHVAQLQVDYAKWLSDRLEDSGFLRESLKIDTYTPKRQTAATTPKGKEPTYEPLGFQISGKATLDSAARMLRELHSAPLLHQVRSLSLAVPANLPSTRRQAMPTGTLDVTMKVEALMVQGAEERASLMPSATLAFPVRVLADPARDYGKLAQKNMFVGLQTPERPRVEAEDRTEVLRFVKLTTIFYNPERRRWEASLYDQAAGPTRVEERSEEGELLKVNTVWEKQLNTRVLNELKISDRFKNTIFEGKVVHIDERQLVLKVDNKFYRLRCGDTLYPAVEKPLSASEVKELGLAAE